MQDFLSFTEVLLPQISGFLMSEPIIWFVGLFLLFGVVKTFKYICTL